MENTDIFVCENCGEEYAKWQGRCDSCKSWNTLKEFKLQKTKSKKSSSANLTAPVKLTEINIEGTNRIPSGVAEFDRVLGQDKNGCGIVAGSVILLGGDPGIGKSTLLLEISAKLKNALYVSGEESLSQIKLRFDRLKINSSELKVLSETDLEIILNTIEKEKPEIVIIDSIQTVFSDNFPSTPGSIVQVRECALRLQQMAKSKNTTVILVGHVTKEGNVAGPRTLEHLVDVVLYLEGEKFQNIRILRGVKNRFGPTDEIGVFEMKESGLQEVVNPSMMFLEQRNHSAGSVITAMIEGTRAILVEIQALTTHSPYGYPQRRVSGYDLNRLQLLIAILEKRAGINFSDQDVFVNVVGGVKINEPAADLAIAMALVSAAKNIALNKELVVFGELGLSGEIRQVSYQTKRESEAKRLGYKKIIQSKNLIDAIREEINVSRL